MTRERYHLLIEVLPATVPAAVRLRQFLKRLLRSLGMRCLRIEPVGGPMAEASAVELPEGGEQ